jgi:hypothetical protein
MKCCGRLFFTGGFSKRVPVTKAQCGLTIDNSGGRQGEGLRFGEHIHMSFMRYCGLKLP